MGIQGCYATIDLGSYAFITNIGVYSISKIYGRGTLGKLDQIAFWGENKNAVLK